jgi:hypothetical protein
MGKARGSEEKDELSAKTTKRTRDREVAVAFELIRLGFRMGFV